MIYYYIRSRRCKVRRIWIGSWRPRNLGLKTPAVVPQIPVVYEQHQHPVSRHPEGSAQTHCDSPNRPTDHSQWVDIPSRVRGYYVTRVVLENSTDQHTDWFPTYLR